LHPCLQSIPLTDSNSRQERLRTNIQGKSAFHKHLADNIIRLDDVLRTRAMSNTHHVVQEVHDILKSYYKVARKRFVDSLCMQAANYHLVTGPNSPLRLFGPSFVAKLTETQLREIAGEDAALRKKRESLVKKITGLEAGKKVLS
jgi:hypothetical protein